MTYSLLLHSLIALAVPRVVPPALPLGSSRPHLVSLAAAPDCGTLGPLARAACYISEAVEFVVSKALQTGTAIDHVKLADRLSDLNLRVIKLRTQKRDFLKALQQPGLSTAQRLALLPPLQQAIQGVRVGLDSVERNVAQQRGEAFAKARQDLADFDKSWVNDIGLAVQAADSARIRLRIDEGNKAVRQLDDLSASLGKAVASLAGPPTQ